MYMLDPCSLLQNGCEGRPLIGEREKQEFNPSHYHHDLIGF